MARRIPGDRRFFDQVETGMAEGFMIDRATLALQKCMQSKMDETKWRELGYELGKRDIIEHHPRLLRALRFGDEDYGGAIFQILPELLGDGLQNLQALETFLDLPEWLKHRQPALYAELYAGATEPTVPLEQVEEASGIHNVGELNRHAARIRASIDDDPEQAIGSAKELLETVLKTIVGDASVTPTDDIQSLIKKARTALDLEPKGSGKAGEIVKRTVSNLGQIVVGVAEVRNLHGTGHGRVNSPELERAHARLVVNSAITVATFLLELKQSR